VAFLLDTDTISALLRAQPSVEIVRRFAAVPPDEQLTSAITFGELLYGARRRGSGEMLQRIYALLDQLPILPFDDAAADRYGTIKADLERVGMPLDEPDLRIAAIALVNGLTLVTGNERHFRRIPGLTVENWLR
jgi:tRNA(fMet)-specific endonuclease VapC